MKKAYCKGFKYSSYKSLIQPTTIILENNGKYGVDKLEAQITYFQGKFIVVVTDGFTNLKIKSGFHSLKQTLNHAHAWMVDFRKEIESNRK